MRLTYSHSLLYDIENVHTDVNDVNADENIFNLTEIISEIKMKVVFLSHEKNSTSKKAKKHTFLT